MTTYCEDCAHFRPQASDNARDRVYYARCAVATKGTNEGLVSRTLSDDIRYCSAARSSIGPCGADAKLYQPA